MAQMKPLFWTTAASLVSAAAVTAIAGVGPASAAVWIGLAAPLVVVVTSWMLVSRTFVRQPDRSTSVMMAAFAAKLVLFGGYAAFAVAVLRVPPVPFALSFAVSLIVLYAAEAVCLQRLFAERMPTA